MPNSSQGPGAGRLLFGLLVIGILALVALEGISDHVAGQLYSEEGVDERWLPLLPVIRAYLRAKVHVFGHLYIYVPLGILVPGLLFYLLRGFARGNTRAKEWLTGMWHRKQSYELGHPFASAKEGVVVATRAAWAQGVVADEEARQAAAQEGSKVVAPPPRIVLGVGPDREPVYLDERARSMHVHLLGQTGSGKTQGVIFPMMWQDAARGAPILFLDAKGSIENEEMVASIAAATGRSDELKMLSFNSARQSQSYNPVYLTPSADPRAVAERAFSTFDDEMDNPFYRNTAAEFFCHLVEALAATGKQITLRDPLACLIEPDILFHALSQSSDRAACRQITSAINHFGPKLHEHLAGLRVALQRFSHPLLNSYDPDIVLEDLLDGKGIYSFSLSANTYKLMSRSVGMMLLQHLQYLGAMRQQDRTLCQRPIYVFIDEFWTFAYKGFMDAVNKLRDANISLLLSHQSLADLNNVSPEYAQGIWDNTRSKIVCYQSDAELGSRLAESVGTRREVKETFRKSADPFLNSGSMFEASSREVDEFILHPSHTKNLAGVGQAYLVQTGVGGPAAPTRRFLRRKPKASSGANVAGVNLPMLGALPPAPFPTPKQADESTGLGLWRLLEESDAA